MPNRLSRSRLGVIIGRFQVDNISEGHMDLICKVRAMHEKVLILLGCSPVPTTMVNPLDYPTREMMIKAAFPEITCLPIMDQKSDEIWSQHVDSTIRTVFPIGSVTIYGGRDSFLPYYHGGMDAVEFPAADYRPGTEIRAEIGNMVPSTPEGRRGVIYATQNRYPTSYQCVDVVITDGRFKIIAGKRPQDQGLLRLPGGFVDPGETLERAVRREIFEEVGCDVSDPWYITSRNTEDWRFRRGTDGLTTALFGAMYVHGPTKGGDDLPEAFWIEIIEHPELADRFVPGHVELVKSYLEHGRRCA